MLRPLENRVLVRAFEASTESEGGLVIPEAAQEAPIGGVVVAAGSECQFVAEGDEVLYGKYMGAEVTLPEGEFLILRESEVLGIL